MRGSSMLLGGRMLAIGIDFLTHVLIVRYLAQGDYGAFAFALSVVSLGSSISVFGLDKTITRFVPIYQERNDFPRLFGSIFTAIGTVAGLGLALALLVIGLQDHMTEEIVESSQARDLLLILILLAPVQALDSLLIGLFAVFASPRSIFLRRYVVAPGLQFAVVMLVMLNDGSVELLAAGYVLAGAVGVGAYFLVFARLLGRRGMGERLRADGVRWPIRELFGFSVPLLSSDLVLVLRSSLVVILLQFLGTSVDVALYRAVVPIARQNTTVLHTFGILYTPNASRLYAQGDRRGINDLYWSSAAWIAVVTYPVFVVTFALAGPVTVLLYGERYADSAAVLALLALGQYFSAVLGFNALTLRVFARVRYIVGVDLVTALLTVAALLLLIPPFGALGGAIATCGTLVVQNVLYQVGLSRAGIETFAWSRFRVHAVIATATAVVAAIQWLLDPPLVVGLAVAALASLVVLGLNRDVLNIAETFPEIMRFSLARRLFGGEHATRG